MPLWTYIFCADFTCRSQRNSAMATLIVGPSTTNLSYPRAILGFFGVFGEKASYGSFAEAQTLEIHLPEDDLTEIKMFGAWAQTGSLYFDMFYILGPSTIEGTYAINKSQEVSSQEREDLLLLMARLWILGDRLLAPKFSNAVMENILDFLECELISAKSEGPFEFQSAKLDYRKSWLASIAKGGDLIVACVEAGGFHNVEESAHPSLPRNRHKYMEKVEERKAEEWRVGEDD